MTRLRSAILMAVALVATLALPARSMAGSIVFRAAAAQPMIATTRGSAISATSGSAALLPSGHDWTVTLITGDVVTVRTTDGEMSGCLAGAVLMESTAPAGAADPRFYPGVEGRGRNKSLEPRRSVHCSGSGSGSGDQMRTGTDRCGRVSRSTRCRCRRCDHRS